MCPFGPNNLAQTRVRTGARSPDFGGWEPLSRPRAPGAIERYGWLALRALRPPSGTELTPLQDGASPVKSVHVVPVGSCKWSPTFVDTPCAKATLDSAVELHHGPPLRRGVVQDHQDPFHLACCRVQAQRRRVPIRRRISSCPSVGSVRTMCGFVRTVRGFVRLSGKPVGLLDQAGRLSVQKSKPAKVQEMLLDEGTSEPS